ncbi:MAG TPA: hypothetical protein ENO11_00670, partial [Desulfobacteraceae bacterium]|nr:hypothetical protein [Desulfobacteraceae bacterium]
MDFKELLEKSWKSFTAFLPALLVNTLVLLVVSVFTLGILAPVCTAGYIQSLLLAIRDDRKPEIGDLFSHMNLFLPLLGFFIVAGMVIFVGFLLLVLPGIIAAIALYFFCLYMLPLMTDKGMGLIEAVKESSRMAMEDPVVEHVAVVAIYIGITALGQVVPFGIVFAMPFATLFLLYAFEEKCGVETGKAQPEKRREPEAAAPPPPPP